MSTAKWDRFSAKVGESEDFRTELAELSLRHGMDISQGEPSEDDPGNVAGGAMGLASTPGLTSPDLLQASPGNQAATLQILSSISKLMHDASPSIINELG